MRRIIRQDSDIKSLFNEGRWATSLIEKAREQAEGSTLSADWIAYHDICHTLRGMGIHDCLTLWEKSGTGRILSSKMYLKLCNTILTNSLEAGPSDRHALFKESLGEVRPSFVSAFTDILGSGYLGSSLLHYPALLADSQSCIDWGLHFDWTQNHYRRLAMRLQDSTTSLQKGLRQVLDHGDRYRNRPGDRPVTIALVANSPDLLGQGKGEAIDSHDLVIRFNKISAETAQVKHTGKRTDIWVMSPSTSIEHCPPDTKLVIVSGLNALTRPSFYWRKLSTIGKPLTEFDSAVWYELVQRFNAPPSAGTLAFAALQKIGQNLQIQRFGFTTTHGVHGLSPNHHNDQARVSSRHNWQAEVDWLRESVS